MKHRARRLFMASLAVLVPLGLAGAISAPAAHAANRQPAQHAKISTGPLYPYSCSQAQQQTDIHLVIDNHEFYGYADTAHSWNPLQGTTDGGDGYASWNYCWSSQGELNGMWYGYVYFYNRGVQEWMGNGSAQYNEQDSTANGGGPDEEYYFTCNTAQDGTFELSSNAVDGWLKYADPYEGLARAEYASYGAAGEDTLYNDSGSGFCYPA